MLSSVAHADTTPDFVASCPITVGTAPADQEWQDVFSYGGEVLSVQLYTDGWGHGKGPPESNYRIKLWWFTEGYKGLTDPVPFLTVTGRRLDAEDDPAYVEVSKVVESVESALDGTGDWSMLALVEFPSPGCWEITGEYGGQILTFVVLAGEHEHVYSSEP